VVADPSGNCTPILERSDADIVAATAIMYGPPSSGIRAVTGLFPGDQPDPRYNLSAAFHGAQARRVQRIGCWRSAELAQNLGRSRFPAALSCGRRKNPADSGIDSVQIQRRVARGAYKRRDVSEQRGLLTRMRSEGEAFRVRELTATWVRPSRIRMPRIESSTERNGCCQRTHAAMAVSSRDRDLLQMRSVASLDTGTLSFFPGNQEDMSGYLNGTKPRRRAKPLGPCRWTGPACESTIVLPVRLDRPIEVGILILRAIEQENAAKRPLVCQ
jgi:hypothetical protein